MRRWIKGLIGAVSISLVGIIVSLTPAGLDLEQGLGLRWLFLMRGPIEPPANVAVIAIDDQTGGHLGLSKLPRNWPRSVHGHLVDTLKRLGASVIVFDFDFQTPKLAEDDIAFAKSVAVSGRVVLTEKLIGKRQPILGPDGTLKGALWVEQLVAPIPILADAAKASGTFPLPKVDVAVHEFWAFKHGVEYAPTTPALALQLHMHNAYPKLVKLLEDVNASEAASLPRRIEKADRNKEIRRLTMKLRRMFRQTSQHHPKLDESIERIRNGNATAENSDQLEALVGLYSGNDNRYLNFYGPPGTITTIPYHKILSKTAPGAGNNLPDLTGKVVFVGYSDIYDPSQPDRFYTVFTNDDGVDLSGVEIAATAFGNLLTNRTLSHPESTTTVSIMGLFGGTVGGLTQLLPAIVSVPITLVIGGIYLYCSEWVFSQNNLWLPLAVPLLFQLPLALFSGLVAQYLSERRKQKRATRAISFYIPNKLAKEFTEKNMESSALNKVTYSICFASDMAGFTTISEQLRPKELAAFLNDYFETFSIALRNHRVDVTEFRADGIMCAWTAEKPHPEIHRHALMAALEAVEAISRFSERQPLLTQPLRIGLEAGMVYVGHSGGGGHYVYSIVGDCANTAARIEGLNKKMGTRILANRSVLEGVNGLIMRYLGDFQFVGKTEALPIVEVMAAEETATPSQQILCQRYEEAMKVFSSGRFTDAAALFEAILSEYPNDGPSRFHLSYCQNQINNPTSSENPSIIRMDSK